ncbi:amidohydrolase family protein [Catenulispora pinisilvae]|uniref:amidohydrolase family protein n=1 Tax=Catenulispora pinisilvae TaxID=2705253 RepID=UPI001891DCD7|nr:amidohydrolase family protein [Catenulispora pinisilvae]
MATPDHTTSTTDGTSSADRIDVHQHLFPPSYRELLGQLGEDNGGWPLPGWSPQEAVAMMDRRSIATGILSLSAPGVHFGDDAKARDLARSTNEYTAELAKDRPDRFGQFASIPLPDVEGSVAEAVYALDELHADGVVLLSNARGRYLGDKEFEPLWAELDARSAVVFIHPTAPPMPVLERLPSPVLDFPFDTTRTALHMVANGVMSRYPRLKVILSHAGGFLPYAATRFSAAAQFSPGTTPEGILADLRRFYFDTALSATPYSLPSLLAFAAPGHVLYGSDFPFATEPWVLQFDAGLDDYPDWKPGQQHAVNRGNAEVLFPRLAKP